MSKIQLYCRCEHCKEYFKIGGRASKIRLYCKRSCRDAAYYLRKQGRNMVCENCDGQGWVSGYGHDCDGTEQECSMRCPIQTQEYCIACGGYGEINE